MSSQARSFTKHLLVFLIPFYVMVIYYLYTDPWRVLYHYQKFYHNGEPQGVVVDRDYVSIQSYIDNDPVFHYNAFILGNSRSLFYRVAEWQKYIGNQSCIHLDASGETLYGVNRKVKFLDERGVKMKNVLWVMDAELLSGTTNSKGVLGIKHPAISGQNKFSFQMEFFKTFLDYRFLIDYTHFEATHDTAGFFGVLDSRIMNCDPATNELTMINYDSMIRFNPAAYYAERAMVFYQRDSIQHTYPVVIQKEQKALLEEMRSIWAKDSTNYKIIINPLYDQFKINPADKAYLDSLFGANHVFDYSGINDITQSKFNYYERSHYLPRIATRIIREVYTGTTGDSVLVR